jgi:hypothetical protein
MYYLDSVNNLVAEIFLLIAAQQSRGWNHVQLVYTYSPHVNERNIKVSSTLHDI